ncbi:hypothetical protein [Halobacillus karajensis]|uniref:Uncharacterized protein n=1 Tax=Halobacillus karajensis TaxID=195088 RepID=A0A059NW62_9BACI|nr:hypothetical protein [Halobacillus karajensis]CDQ22550.1 hypothetical protein BN983_00763 [Halobacillus karajensis]CDQ26032.1 hypothetical protein BN981_00243 [Halobacillus karajensis]
MTNEQTVIQIMKLDQTGMGGMTKEGEAYLQKLMQDVVAQEQTEEESPKLHSYLYTRLIRSTNKARTYAE